MLNFRTRRATPVFKKSSPRDKASMTRIFQGLFFIALGLVFIVANASSSNPNKEITGHITQLYEHTVNGQYDSNWLQINTDPQNLYIFDKNALHPAWNNKFFIKERVDIYYLDETPRRVTALQFYDLFGDPTTKYTTDAYQPNQPGMPLTSTGLDIGLVLALIGLFLIGLTVKYRITAFLTKRSTQATGNSITGS
jgi:hypothetical protein